MKIYINCDGGSRGNPGKAAIGIVLWDESHNILAKYKEKIGIATNNVAEYTSLIKALQLASSYTKDEVIVNMDSELTVRQAIGEYKVKANHLFALYQAVKRLELNFKKISYNNVKRSDIYQMYADQLVNEALDGQ